MSKIYVCMNRTTKEYHLKFGGDFSIKSIWNERTYPTQILDDIIIIKGLLNYISRKENNAANNNRQISLWQKMVLFGLRVQRSLGFK